MFDFNNKHVLLFACLAVQVVLQLVLLYVLIPKGYITWFKTNKLTRRRK